MTQIFEDAGKYGKEFVELGLEELHCADSRARRRFRSEASDYAKNPSKPARRPCEKLISAKSLENAFEIQTDYAKQAYEGFVAEATKISDLYADMAKDSLQAVRGVVAKAK